MGESKLQAANSSSGCGGTDAPPGRRAPRYTKFRAEDPPTTPVPGRPSPTHTPIRPWPIRFEIAVGPTGQVWVISGGQVYVLNATWTWDVVNIGPGTAKSITLDENSFAWVTMEDGAIFRYVP